MSVTTEDVSSSISLDIAPDDRPIGRTTRGRDPGRRKEGPRRNQARRAGRSFFLMPLRRIAAMTRVLTEAATRRRPRNLILEMPGVYDKLPRPR